MLSGTLRRTTSKRYAAGTLLVSLLLGSAMTACCEKRLEYPEAPVLVVDKTEMRPNPDNPGEFIVTEGWLQRRLEYEQALLSELASCRQSDGT